MKPGLTMKAIFNLAFSSSLFLNTPLQGTQYHLDPIASFTSTIPGSPLFRDGYGATVRLNGDWAFVAAPFARVNDKIASGAIYVYKKGRTGYKETQIITTGGISDHFGELNIVSHDDWLLISLIGTPAGNVPPNTLDSQNFTGSIQIYHLENNEWVFHSALDRTTPGLQELSEINPAALNPPNDPFLNEQGANFGLNFSLNWKHRILLVGAQYQANLTPSNIPLINVGAVYAFRYNEKKHRWVLTEKIISPDGIIQNDAFGANVVTDGNYALISNGVIFALPKPTNTSVYVFKRKECGTWKFIQKIHGDQTNTTPTDFGLVGDAFGNTLALKDGLAVIGAPCENLGTTKLRGAAYFYKQNKKGKFKRVFKTISQDPNSIFFAFPLVKIHNNKVYLSDTNFSSGGITSQGAISVYAHKLDRWRFVTNLVNPTPLAFGFFGESFDFQGNTIGVGAGLLNAGFTSSVKGAVKGAVPALGISI